MSGVAASRQDARRQDMVDTPAEIPLESVAKEIPVSVLNDIRVKFAKDIDESQGDDFFVGIPSVDVKIDIVHTLLRVIDVNRFGGDIEIANPDRRLRWI